MILADVQGLDAGACFYDLIAAVLEYLLCHISQHGFIFHQENGFVTAAGRRGRGDKGLFRSDRLRTRGEVKSKNRAFAQFTGDLNPPLVLFDDAVHSRQSKTGALADFFGSEKWLE